MTDHDPTPSGARPYPADWERVADVRVFRAAPGEWEKLAGWRTEMLRKGWRLLRVQSDARELIAVFGRTRRP